MGTHSMIGVVNADGSVTATYCHYDGYLEGNGRTLVESYNTPEAARAVAETGYLSGLTENLTESINGSAHKNQVPVPYESVMQFMENGYDWAGAEYLYLFDGEAWFYASRYAEDNRFEEVEMNLKAA